MHQQLQAVANVLSLIIRHDPFERFPMVAGETALTGAFGYENEFFAHEFWRFVVVQQAVADLSKTAINYPPMLAPASFNLDAVKKQIDDTIKGSRRTITGQMAAEITRLMRKDTQ